MLSAALFAGIALIGGLERSDDAAPTCPPHVEN